MSGLQFRPILVRQIQRGEKTQTRRLVKGPLRCPGCGRETLHGVCTCHEPENRPIRTVPISVCRYKAGKSVAVQPGRGKAAMCRIRILEVEQQLAGDITLPDALAEGFRTTDEFKQYWIGLHDKPWLAAQTRTVEKAQADADPDDAVIDIDAFLNARSLDRFEDRHTETPVWLILFELDETPKPRFLAARAQEQYVTNPARAMTGEPEAVTAHEQALITERAGMEYEQWQALDHASRDMERALLSFEDRLVRARREAKLKHIDVSGETYLIHTRIRRGAPPASIIPKLEKLERRVDGRKEAA